MGKLCDKRRLHVSFKMRARNGAANGEVTVVFWRLGLTCTCPID